MNSSMRWRISSRRCVPSLCGPIPWLRRTSTVVASPLHLSCEFVVEGHVVIFRGNLNRVPAKGILNFNGVQRQGGSEGACLAIPQC